MMKKNLGFLFSPPALAALFSAAIMIYVLFLFPVGMADNGDYYRVINGNGLYKLDRGQVDEYFEYFSTDYGIYQYYNEYESSLISSQTLFIRTALTLDKLFTKNDSIFDIRFLSAIIGIWAVFDIYMLVNYATRFLGNRNGYIAGALAVLIFADTGYTSYFNSFYAEGLVFVSFLGAAASALLIFQNRSRPRALLAFYIFNSLTLITAKQQNAPLGFLLGLLILPLIFHIFRQQPHKTKSLPIRKTVFAASCSLLLCGCGVLVYFSIPQEFVDINKFHSMTRGITISSANPETALDHFDINPQYSLLDGAIYYERYPSVDVEGRELKTDFYPNYGFISVIIYYIEHPEDFSLLLNRAAKVAYIIRPDEMGNYLRSAGKSPGQKTSFFALHSWLKRRIAPQTVGFICFWIAIVLGLNFENKKQMMVLGCAITLGLAQIVVSIIGAGDADLAKHIFLYNVAFDLTNYILVSTVFLKWIDRRREKSISATPATLSKSEEESIA